MRWFTSLLRRGHIELVLVISVWISAGTALLHPAAYAQRAPNDTAAIVGATLIDGTGRAPLKDAVIVIEGNKIKAVGPKGGVSYPPNAKIIDATGKFVLPGLFDSHVHYRDFMPELLLAHGITSIIDMGSPIDWILAQRDGINKRKIPGPRMFVSGDAISPGSTSGAGGATMYSVITFPSPPARTPEETRKVVRELISRGVDKIAVNINQDPATFPVIVEEARKANLPISAYTMFPREQVSMGLDAIEHSYSIAAGTKRDPKILEQMRRERFMSRYDRNPFNYLGESDADDFIQLLVQKKAYVIPSLVFEYKVINDRQDEFKQQYYEILTNPNLRYLPLEDYFPQVMNYEHAAIPRLGGPGFFGTLDRKSEKFRQYHKGYRELQTFLRKLVQAGGKVLVGTDTPNMLLPGITLHHEMQLLVDAGLTPMQVIVGATKDPATFIRKQDLLGTLEAGKLADLLILRADPLQDIRNTRKIDLVMKDGQVLETSFHANFTNPIPRSIVFDAEMYPVPAIRNIAPKGATEGDSDVTLMIDGSGFVETSAVAFDGNRLPVTFVTEMQLKATVPAHLLQRVGTFPVTVWNSRPGGGLSNEAKFIVRFR